MRRRDFLATPAAALALQSVARAQKSAVLKFIPQADLVSVDPIRTTAYVTRNHAFMVFDTLYGQTGAEQGFVTAFQMVVGHSAEDDGKIWKPTLRDGLMFHDGTKVLGRDCLASIRRWSARDAFGQTLMQRCDELSAPDDRTIMFRLKKPMALLPDALGKHASNMCAIMPGRLASTDPFKQVDEVIGSGPFRFKADERVPGSLFVYDRFKDYRAGTDGKADFTSGPKITHFDRVEWHVIADAATAATALQTGEVDWWELPTSDLLPLFRRGE
jgi:peptide/nickel transport system substrate-binding protein